MMTPIAPHIEAFLRENLSHHRGASQHTCDSYGYSFQLLFEFAAARLGVTPSALALEQLDSGLVSAFLEYLEDTRRNALETRNVRLAAIKSFFRFLEYRQPAALEQIRRVLAIPFKSIAQKIGRSLEVPVRRVNVDVAQISRQSDHVLADASSTWRAGLQCPDSECVTKVVQARTPTVRRRP